MREDSWDHVPLDVEVRCPGHRTVSPSISVLIDSDTRRVLEWYVTVDRSASDVLLGALKDCAARVDE